MLYVVCSTTGNQFVVSVQWDLTIDQLRTAIADAHHGIYGGERLGTGTMRLRKRQLSPLSVLAASSPGNPSASELKCERDDGGVHRLFDVPLGLAVSAVFLNYDTAYVDE